MKKHLVFIACMTALGAVDPDPQIVQIVDQQITEIKEAARPPMPRFQNPYFYPPIEVVEEVEGAPVAPKPPVVTEPKLESIIGKKAMLNGGWLKVGDTAIGGWKVKAITVDSVVLTKGKTTRRLILNSGVSGNYLIKVGEL
ncbi:MAG: hypothetical protein LBN32_02985 [Helicobacteraceae bacterium]|nr:hypothetical protein [Helicobacteraceae bacterium]